MVEGPQNIRFNTQKISGKSKVSGSSKNFEKILRKKKREGQESFGEKEKVEKKDKNIKSKNSFEEIAEHLEIKESPKKTNVSLFDIAKGEEPKDVEKPEAELEGDLTFIPKEISDESLSALFKGYGSKEKLTDLQKEVASAGIEKPKEKIEQRLQGKNIKGTQPFQEKSDVSKPAKFIQEAPDLTSINPLAASGKPTATDVIQTKEPAAPIKSHILEIVKAIIDKLSTVKAQGKTETIISIKQHSSLFRGANIVITSFDHAKGEFNIAFENLTQVAKNLLDRQENKNSLKLALEQKGYTVHIITATTLNETMPLAEAQKSDRGEERHGQGERQEKEEEEEEG